MKKIFFLLYTLSVALFIVLKIFSPTKEIYRAYNLIPFKTLERYGKAFPSRWSLVNIIANVLPFALEGIFIKKLFYWNFLSLFSVICAIIIIIELLQVVLMLGTFDIDDIWMNSLSVFIGYVLSKRK